jgi:hypothetical protein
MTLPGKKGTPKLQMPWEEYPRYQLHTHPSYIKPPPIFTPNTVAMNVRAREYGTRTKSYMWETVGVAKWYKY